jgi:predicted RNase H-like HicB family nuclease
MRSKLIDRFTGEQPVDMPSLLIEGRYVVTAPMWLGGHTQFKKGEPLIGDGTALCRLDDVEVSFSIDDLAKANEARSRLCAEAIRSIADRSRSRGLRSTTPLLEINLDEEVEATKLERLLRSVVADHHLRAIEEAPNVEVEYTEEVTPVGRARRLATRAATHLASHSELWQQRTFTGVVPREVLARFSNDRYATYENVVFARLLDRLDQILVRRWERLNELRANLEAGRDFQQADQRSFHRLYARVCELWGEVYQGDSAEEGLDSAKTALDEVTELLTHVRNLRQGNLYKQISRAAQVPDTVQRTNLLMHDQHYRHLPRLWESIVASQAARKPTAAEVARQRLRLQADYSQYVGVVLARAVQRYGVIVGKGMQQGSVAGLESVGLDWILKHRSGQVLRVVPLACWSSDLRDACQSLPSGTLICSPEPTESSASTSLSLPTTSAISPLDLFVVERMGLVVDKWFAQCLARTYGHAVARVPSAVTEECQRSRAAGVECAGATVRVLTPIRSPDRDRILQVAGMTGSRQTAEALANAFRDVELLAACPECGLQGSLLPQQHHAFWATCQDPACQSNWGVQVANGRRLFRLEPRVVDTPVDFEAVGRSRFAVQLE